ncbi:hypothetical protein JCGZ_12556 [Jatropha curcas]|uniref:Uncharacterized protein n=1 Tax=Jatropha curcas TaxID=180498 RepID=A0A067KIK3_JATCU|nr:uncharacterized protein LOC105639995 [Jatropha curcas]KDP32095.1 hypothetical protein JCGZ_12556 [Jatropha curcas]
MDTKKPTSKQSKLSKLIKIPIKVLIKTRDFYIRSMNVYADQLGYGAAIGCPVGQVVHNLPRSYSVSSTNSNNRDDDYRELLKVASTRDLSRRVELDLLLQRQKSRSSMPRSFSVGIGRIDEEQECEFEEDFKVKADAFPRSRSYAVSRRSTTRVL